MKRLLLLVQLLMILWPSSLSAYNSILEYENKAQESSGFNMVFGHLNLCFGSKDKVVPVWQYGEFSTTYMPTVIEPDEQETTHINLTAMMTTATAVRATVYAVLGGSIVLTPLAFLGLIGEYTALIDICTNMYVVQPHEFVNRDILQLKCEKNPKSKTYEFMPRGAGINQINPMGPEHVPFFYTCNPQYNYINGRTITDPEKEGLNYGYMDEASDFCQGNLKSIATNREFQRNIGAMLIEYVPIMKRFTNLQGYGEPCNARFKEGPYSLRVDGKAIPRLPYEVYSYYRVDRDTGKFQICAVTPKTLMPIRIGCSQVAPPISVSGTDEFIDNYLNSTICSFFLYGRQDLQSLGRALPSNDSTGKNKDYVKHFLQSEMHWTSTVVGCIQDMLYKVFMGDVGFYNQGDKKTIDTSFFIRVRDGLKGIVLAVLVLYVCVAGIQFMIDPEFIRKKGEILMLIVKFGAVFYFAVGNVWFDNEDGKRTGLLSFFMEAPAEITSIVLSAYNQNDPIGYCQYQLGSQELFDEIEINKGMVNGDLTNTPGFDTVKMSVWDLVDCKVANYINFGSCKYTFVSTLLWVGTTAFWAGGLGLILLFVSSIYLFLLLLIIFRFVHVFILSMFLITILVFLAPIFVLFALFKPTFQIFRMWFTMLIGYVLYPGMNFIFISFMFATLDIANYGPITEFVQENAAASNMSVKEICNRSGASGNTALCTTIDVLGLDNPCLDSSLSIPPQFLTKKVLIEFLDWHIYVLKPALVSVYMKSITNLMLFTLLFYFLLGAILYFMSVVLGIWFPGQEKGSINIANPLGALFNKLVDTVRR